MSNSPGDIDVNSDPFTLVTGDMRGFITHQDKQKEQAIVRIPLNQLLKVVDVCCHHSICVC